MGIVCARSRTLFFRTLFRGGLLLGAPSAEAASVGAGSLFQSGGRHLRFGAEEPTLRNEIRVADGRAAGRSGSKHRLALSARGELAIPEPGAALLFGLGALAIARVRRRV
jgi:PEP-CTERM motif